MSCKYNEGTSINSYCPRLISFVAVDLFNPVLFHLLDDSPSDGAGSSFVVNYNDLLGRLVIVDNRELSLDGTWLCS